jgi:hypothetical protein
MNDDVMSHACDFLANIEIQVPRIYSNEINKEKLPINDYNNDYKKIKIDSKLCSIIKKVQIEGKLDNSTIDMAIDCFKKYIYKSTIDITDPLLALSVYLVLACKFNEDSNINNIFDIIYRQTHIKRKHIIRYEHYYYEQVDYTIPII